MTITLVDGSERTFLFDHRPDGRLKLASRFENLLLHHSLAIQLPDKLLVIPLAQIKAIEFTPAPSVHLEQLVGPAQEVTLTGA
jgi:hypothetical protein